MEGFAGAIPAVEVKQLENLFLPRNLEKTPALRLVSPPFQSYAVGFWKGLLNLFPNRHRGG